MADNLDHKRAKYAVLTIDNEFQNNGSVPNDRKKELDDYSNKMRGAGAFIQECGLAQVLSFWYGKGTGSTEEQVARHILGWLQRSPVTQSICPADARNGRLAISGNVDVGDSIKAMLQRTSQQISILEDEALAIVQWLKRLATGLSERNKP